MNKTLITKLELINFLSHEHTVMEFDGDEKMIVDGVSGSGKSSLVDAVVWALYGNSRSENKSLVHNGKEKATVRLYLSRGDSEFKIERSTTTKPVNKLEVYVKDGDIFEPIKKAGIKEKQDYIVSDIIGCSYLMFVNSVVFPQDNQENFSKQAAAKRKDMILELVNINDIDDLYGKSRDALVAKKNTLEVVKIEEQRRVEKVEELKRSLESLSSVTLDVDTLTVEQNSLTAQIQKKQQELANTVSLIDSAEKNNARRKSLEFSVLEKTGKLFEVEPVSAEQIDEAERRLESAEAEKAKSVQLEARLNQSRIELDRKKGELRDKKNKVARCEALIEETKVNIENARSAHKECPHKEPVCAVCCVNSQAEKATLIQPFLDLLKRNENDKIELLEDTKAVERQISNLEQEVQVSQEEYDKVAAVVPDVAAIKNGISALKNQREVFLAAERLSDEIRYIQEQLESIELVDVYEELSKKTRIEEALQSLKGELTHTQELLAKAQYVKGRKDEIARELKSVEGSDEIERKVKELEEDIASLELVKNAFGNNGIKATVIEIFVPQLEENINSILSRLSDMRVELSTQRSGTGERVVDGLFIDVLNQQNERMDINNYSGGEKIKINTSISEGLAMFQSIGFRIWDENIIGFDAETIDGFVEVFSGLESGIDQIMCISHIQQVKDLFNKHATVRKDGTGVSIVSM